ncbi:MAG: FAD synthetase family protein [Spirochaetales bacterium]|jgi:riboflavin kinase/FMN adenylyltransferase|nr:FAD synthetase family protein [Spirochaetales bacterium]
MRILSWEEFLRLEKKDNTAAMTIGVFDGLHAGHQRLIERVREFSKSGGAQAWLITFRENPKKILRPAFYCGDILPLRNKLEKLESFGIHTAVIIDFSAGLSKLKGIDFMSLLCGHCMLSYLAIGEDFHFGWRMDTNAGKAREFLVPLGVKVEILPPVYHGGSRISSTRIRDFISGGDFRAAVSMLGYPYRIFFHDGGKKDGAARTALTQVIPKAGRYPVFFEGTAGGRNGFADVDADGISWHYDGNVDAITFV